MRARDFIPAVLFGLLLGALLMLLVRDPQRLSAAMVPSLVAAVTTIVVGWWIHSAVRRRGELDRVPIDHISDLSTRIGGLISDCLQATETNERLSLFRQLGIEIGFLCNLIESTAALESVHLETLNSHYVNFTRHRIGLPGRQRTPDGGSANSMAVLSAHHRRNDRHRLFRAGLNILPIQRHSN